MFLERPRGRQSFINDLRAAIDSRVSANRCDSKWICLFRVFTRLSILNCLPNIRRATRYFECWMEGSCCTFHPAAVPQMRTGSFGSIAVQRCSGSMRRPINLGRNGNSEFEKFRAVEVLDIRQLSGSDFMYPRRFARVRPTGKVSSAAKVIVGPKAPLIDCTVIDYSAGGACLQLDGQVALPPRFELVHGVTRKRCRIVWRAGRRVGVAF